MSLAKAHSVLLTRLASSQTVLLAVLLDLSPVPAWCDGTDAVGRAVFLVGAQALGTTAEAQQARDKVLSTVAEGVTPDGVVVVAYEPAASAAIAEIVAGTSEEVLVHGPRGTGKTQLSPAALAILAERHARAGYALPLRVLWLHDSLTNAAVKTGRSLQKPHWANLWALHDNSRQAVFQVGGTVMVMADFVGTQDPAAGDRTRAECHVVAAEEIIASLNESGGIGEREYDMAISSMKGGRMPTVRSVAFGTTNPGAPETWPYVRFLAPGHAPQCVALAIPCADRMTPEEEAGLLFTFRNSPDLQARLARGEWAALMLGERVAEGFSADVHVGTIVYPVSPDHLLAIGWDGGHSPSAVIGQIVGGQVRTYAALNDIKIGVLELIEQQVIPWLLTHAPWTRKGLASSTLVHILDPSMSTPGQATITESAEKIIRDTLGGQILKGPVRWQPRREAVLRVLAPRHEQGHVPFVINPVPETRLLIKAYQSYWYYPQTPDGRVDRSGPKKPNSPWADIGDASANLYGWLWSGDVTVVNLAPVKVESNFQLSLGPGASFGREVRA